MTTFAHRCALDTPARAEQVASVIGQLKTSGIAQVRFSWCDQHGNLHGKTLMIGAVERALHEGVNMVGTLMLKDISGHTSYKVFEPDALAGMPGFAHAANLVMLPSASFPNFALGQPHRLECCASPGFRTPRRWPSTPGAYCSRRWRNWPRPASA